MTHDDAVQDNAVQDDAAQEAPGPAAPAQPAPAQEASEQAAGAQAAGGSTETAAPKPGPGVSGATTPAPSPAAAPKPGPRGGSEQGPRGGSEQGSNETSGAAPAAGSGLVTPPAVATKEPTGDVVVDAVLDEFDRVTGEPLDAHVEVGEKVHRTLQARLADLGDE